MPHAEQKTSRALATTPTGQTWSRFCSDPLAVRVISASWHARDERPFRLPLANDPCAGDLRRA